MSHSAVRIDLFRIGEQVPHLNRLRLQLRVFPVHVYNNVFYACPAANKFVCCKHITACSRFII